MAEIRTPPRKLTDLHPQWYGMNARHGVAERKGLGLTCDCPCGERACAQLAVAFANPLDGGPPDDWHGRKTLWQRTGEDFETLTLAPSLHLPGHWHGYIQNGMVLSC